MIFLLLISLLSAQIKSWTITHRIFMIDKFGNVFYLIIYLAHFIIVGSYAYQLVFDTKKFLKGRGVDKTATLITRTSGAYIPSFLDFLVKPVLSIFNV